jgi:hypothetical protein
MTRKSITTTRTAVACDVCGRTLLRGEHADPFIANGARRMVCELCTARAANEGWIREGADNTLQVRRNGLRGGGGRSLLERLRPRRESIGLKAPPDAPYRRVSGNVDRIESSGRVRDRYPFEDAAAGAGEPAEAAGALSPPPRAAAAEPHPSPREPRHVRAVPTNADIKMARALDVFNASAHPRRIAGVSRSLGQPVVTVLPSETEGALVTIVVGWELCWYRYGVDLADEAAGVRVTGQGAELTELAEAEQVANAVADERGQLSLRA